MELVHAFPATDINPFDTDASGVEEGAALASVDWDKLPHDVKGLILDHVADNTADFVALSSCSRAWRYAAHNKTQKGRSLEDLRKAYVAERSFAKRDKEQRKRIVKRGVGRRIKSEAGQIVFFLILLVFALANMCGPSVGMHQFYTLSPAVPASPSNCTAGVNVTCCTEGQTDPLRSSAFALSFFWIMYGTGFFVVSSYALVHALRPVRNAAQPDWAALIVGLAVVIILIGAAGLFSVAPCWHFLGEIPSQCVAPSYREPFGSYVIGGTVLFALNTSFVLLVLCFSCC